MAVSSNEHHRTMPPKIHRIYYHGRISNTSRTYTGQNKLLMDITKFTEDEEYFLDKKKQNIKRTVTPGKHKTFVGEYVGSWLRSVKVAVIPGFSDAGGCGRPPRFRTLVTGAHNCSRAALVLFPALQALHSATTDVP